MTDMLISLVEITGGSFSDAVYRFALNTAVDTVLNYCNIDAVPKELENTVVRMAADILRFGQYGKKGGSIPVSVTSVSVGDTSTSYTPLTALQEQSLINNYKRQLNRYRKVNMI